MKMLTSIALLALLTSAVNPPAKFKGAWVNEGPVTTTRIYTDGFFSVALYKSTEFISTYGGRYKMEGENLIETIEFDMKNPERIGTDVKTEIYWSKSGDEFGLGTKGPDSRFKKIDDGTPGKLAGAWLITGRFNNNEMNKITPGARRTMKILSGKRFQWIAYNVETKEFFGTGGGTYKTENGKYTESIDFFSRDQSRVGMSLGFDFSVQDDGSWRHSGKSSKGDPIDEVWMQREKLGI